MSIHEFLLAGRLRFVQGHSFSVTPWIVRRYPEEISG